MKLHSRRQTLNDATLWFYAIFPVNDDSRSARIETVPSRGQRRLPEDATCQVEANLLFAFLESSARQTGGNFTPTRSAATSARTGDFETGSVCSRHALSPPCSTHTLSIPILFNAIAALALTVSPPVEE
jgi:hypothetical protein